MVMKIIGATVLLVSSGVYGIYNGQKIERGLEQTKDLRMGLNLLKQEIYLNGTPLGKAMENASALMATEVKEVFSECGKETAKHNGTSLQEYLLGSINQSNILLGDQCKNIISRWASGAGGGDVKSELEGLEYAISQLDQLIKSVEEECAKKAKLYKSCGFLVGALVVAVLL